MQDKFSSPVVYDAIFINSISHYIYQAILRIYQQSPSCLQEKHRNYAWETSAFQTQLITNLVKNLDPTTNRDELIDRLIALLKKFFIPNFFFSNYYFELISTIYKSINYDNSSQSDSDVAILMKNLCQLFNVSSKNQA